MHMQRRYALTVAALVTASLAMIGGCNSGGVQTGKFCIVGMGTAPDLSTVRAVNTLKKADIIVLSDPEGKDDWKQYVGGKEIWIMPRFACIFLGIDPDTLKDEESRKMALQNAKDRQEMVDRITGAVRKGKIVCSLENGDPMMYGITFYLEMLPKDIPTEVIPGVGAFEAAAAAVKMSPPYGWDTNSVILTMSDWKGRADTNERLMETQTSMIFYTMHLDYPKVFAQLKEHYPADTPVAIVVYAGDPVRQRVIRSTIENFFKDVDLKEIPVDKHMLLVGKFLTAGQARKDGLESGRRFIEMMRYENRHRAKSATQPAVK
jgi:precorrin-4 methylase